MHTGSSQPLNEDYLLSSSQQVVEAVPAARVAGAMLGLGGGSPAEAALVEGLEWLRGWAEKCAQADGDRQVHELLAPHLGSFEVKVESRV